MKMRGLMLLSFVAVAVIIFSLFTKVGEKAPIRSDVDAFVQSQSNLTQATMQVLQKIIASYVATEGQPPASLQELRTAGLLTGSLQDAWGRDIRYERRSDSTYRLTSAGKDRIFDTADDIHIDD
jgi:hypothetical protein